MSVSLSAGTGRAITTILEMIVELPSTPAFVAMGARRHVGDIAVKLPEVHHREPGERTVSEAIELDTDTASAVAELLEVFAEMPSTPPTVSDDARQQAQKLWAQLS